MVRVQGRRCAIRVLVFAAALAAAGASVRAQVGAGELTGVVRDQAGASVAGATVPLTAAGTNAFRVVRSTAGGVYAAPGLAPGDYRVDVRVAGFRPVRRDGVRLATGETVRLDFDL